MTGEEVCDDGLNDGSYGGCAEDCMSLGPYCGDAVVNGSEACDDGTNDGAYDGCEAGCVELGPHCGDAVINGNEICDDGNADSSDGCIGSCVIPTSCLDIHDYDNQAPDGTYAIAPNGYNGDPFDVHCDMTSDGGGYTFLKLAPGQPTFAAGAEIDCASWGMQLWIPRSLEHKNSGWAVANDANIGPGASANYMLILGIYPSFNGATCSSQPMNSSNQGCAWVASDGLDWYVHDVNFITEPNGDNNTIGSMYYAWQMNGDIQWHNDIPGDGYSSSFFMCDVGDKLP